MKLWSYLTANYDRLLQLTFEHVQLALAAVLLGMVVSIPISILVVRKKRLVGPVFWLVNMFQTIPALALVGFLMIFFGLGRSTGIAVLFFYTLMPIIRATYTGLTSVEPAMLEAARGMGMTRRQILLMIQVPLAMSVVVVGLRIATVIAIGTATIMSLAGAGGLGYEIFNGIARGNDSMLVGAAIPVALLSVAANWALGLLERRLTSPGLRG